MHWTKVMQFPRLHYSDSVTHLCHSLVRWTDSDAPISRWHSGNMQWRMICSGATTAVRYNNNKKKCFVPFWITLILLCVRLILLMIWDMGLVVDSIQSCSKFWKDWTEDWTTGATHTWRDQGPDSTINIAIILDIKPIYFNIFWFSVWTWKWAHRYNFK